jgi:dipeptidyl aminopeptidase/acylaminoacyl peptidase
MPKRLINSLLWALVLAPPAAVAAPLPDAVPVEVFAALPAIDRPRLSPDGTKIAAKFAFGGVQRLVVYPLNGGAPAVFQSGSVDLNWWQWAGNGWLAVGLGATEMVRGEEIYVTRTIGVSADLTRQNKLAWARSGQIADDAIWFAHDGSPRILLSKQTGFDSEDEFHPSVYEADLATGRMTLVTVGKPGVFDWTADAGGNVRLGAGYDEATKESFYLYRGSNAAGFTTIKIPKGSEDKSVAPAVFRKDGTAVAFDDPDGRYEIFEMALPSFRLGKKIFGTSKYDTDRLYVSPAGDDVIGIQVVEKSRRTEWFDPRMKALQGEFDTMAGTGTADVVDWSDDFNTLLVQFGSASQAGELHVFTQATGQHQRIAWINDKLRGRMLSPVRTVSYPARDGTAIEAVLTLPRQRQAKNLPVIIMPHGGPFARDDESYDWWTQYLAELGYAVIQPNYRGSSGYGRAFAALGEAQWGLKMQDDLNDALAWAGREGIVDPKRACVVGGSYGGYAAMRAAERDGALYRCAISYAGVSDLGALARYDSGFLGGDVRKKWLRRQAPDFRAVSPRFDAASFAAPILIAHGVEDKRVPVQQSRWLAEALKKAGKTYQYLEQKEGDHHFSRTEDRLEFLKATRAFLDKYNPS